MFTTVFLYQFSGNHDLMSASLTFQAKIRSHAKDLPVKTAAGMFLFQFYHISDFKHHLLRNLLLLPDLYLSQNLTNRFFDHQISMRISGCGTLIDQHHLIPLEIIYQSCGRINRQRCTADDQYLSF